MPGERLSAASAVEDDQRIGEDRPETTDALRRENDDLRDRLAERRRERRRIVDHYERLLETTDDRGDTVGTAVEAMTTADRNAAAGNRTTAIQTRSDAERPDDDQTAQSTDRFGGASLVAVVRRVVRTIR